jgi:hypothetical protein
MLVQPLWKAVWRFLKKLKIELPYDLPKLLLSKYVEKCMSGNNKDICTPLFIHIIHNSLAMETSQMSYNCLIN